MWIYPVISTVLALAAAELPSMVVLEVQAKGANSQVADALTDSLLQELSSSRAVGKIVGTKEMQAAIGMESQRQLLHCDSEGCMAELAGSLGADYLLNPSLGRVGEYYALTLKLVSAKSGVLVASASAQVCAAREGELLMVMGPAVKQLLSAAGLLALKEPIPPLQVRCEGATASAPLAPAVAVAPPPRAAGPAPVKAADAAAKPAAEEEGGSPLPTILKVAGGGMLAVAALPLLLVVGGAVVAGVSWFLANAVGPVGGSYLPFVAGNLGGWGVAAVAGGFHVLLVLGGAAVLVAGIALGVL